MNTKTTLNFDPVSNPILERVAGILWVSEEKLSKTLEKKQIPGTISAILELPEYANHQELALFALEEEKITFTQISPKLRKNPDFIQRIIFLMPHFFSYLSPDEQHDQRYIYSEIKGMVKKRKNFLEVESFLKQYIPDLEEREKYRSFYREYVKLVGYFFAYDIEKYLFELNQYQPELLHSLLERNFFEVIGKEFKIGKSLWTIARDIYASLQSQGINEEQEFIEKLLISLGIKQWWINKKEIWLWKSLYEQVSLESVSSSQEKESKETEVDESSQGSSLSRDEEKINYALPHYISSVWISGKCQIYYNETKSIEMDEKQLQDMTLAALENYMIFLRVFDELGLSFLSERYRDQFLHIWGFHYDSGEGITQARLLRLLNIVGKNIGVPEKKYEDEEGNKKVGCFETLAGAKLAFRYIKETGNINDTFVCAPSERGDYAITEIYLIQNGYIDREGRGLNISKWH